MDGYDIIGDVHGCADQLEALLRALGYRADASGGFGHPSRSLIFVGDLVDRGPGQLRVLEMVKATADAGAQVVMGNHEFNAVSYGTEWPVGSGDYLRPHTAKNEQQHRSFLDQVTDGVRRSYLDWFRTLPLWLDLGELRVVHACWHDATIRAVERDLGSNRFSTTEQWVRSADPGDPLYTDVELLLKGPELSLVDYGQPAYRDKDNHRRDRARICWWSAGSTLRDLALIAGNFTTDDGEPYPELPEIAVSDEAQSYVYEGSVPVFFGHYWRSGVPEEGTDWTSKTACLDFSAVKGGAMTAYRWSGESEIKPENFVQVGG
ncbi:MAG: metallophosphoesterase [Mycobacterium sp.]